MNKFTRAIWILAWVLGIPAAYADDAADYKTLLAEATSHLEKFRGHSQSEAITNLAGVAKTVVIIPDEVAGRTDRRLQARHGRGFPPSRGRLE